MIDNASATSEFVLNLSAGGLREMQASDFVFILVGHQSVQFHGHGQAKGSVSHSEASFGVTRALQHVRVAARVGGALIVDQIGHSCRNERLEIATRLLALRLNERRGKRVEPEIRRSV